jgi:hypothetical protein
MFSALAVLQGVTNPDYDWVALPISALVTWPTGWIQTLNFYAFGALTMLHAVGLHLGIQRRSLAILGPGLLGVSGLGACVAGLVPMTRDTNGALVEPAGHAVGAVLTFLGAGLGLTLVSRRMASDPDWRHLARYTLVCGIAVLCLFLAMASLAVPDEGPLHPWFGLLQRAVLTVWFPCTFILSLRLLRVSKAE